MYNEKSTDTLNRGGGGRKRRSTGTRNGMMRGGTRSKSIENKNKNKNKRKNMYMEFS